MGERRRGGCSENAQGEPTSTNDPLYANGSQWYVDHIRLFQAWTLLPASVAPRIVAVLDTGIQVSHPEFTGRLFVNPLEALDGIDNDGDGWRDDINGAFTFCDYTLGNCTGNILFQNGSDNRGQHGTYTSSILMANTNNTFQGYGADRKVQLLTIRVATFGGIQLLGLTNGFDYLTLHPDFAKIASISIAGLDSSNDEGTCAAPPPDGVLFSSICAAAESTILIVASGNGGLDSGAEDGLPESHPRVITVAGTDIFDQRASFSDGGTSADFSAPAVGIYTSDILGVDPFRSNVDDDPRFADGTSWAAPMVAGIAAMGLAVRPQMTRADLYVALRETTVDLGAPGWDPFFGWGRVDAYGAVLMLKEQLLFVDDFETGDTSWWQ